MNLKSICGVIIASNAPKVLAEFYSGVFDVEFEREIHGSLAEHYGLDIGHVHLGIHSPTNMNKTEVGNSSVTIAYNVSSIEAVMSRLSSLCARQLSAPNDEGFGIVAAYEDPEGNQFEIVELTYQFDAK